MILFEKNLAQNLTQRLVWKGLENTLPQIETAEKADKNQDKKTGPRKPEAFVPTNLPDNPGAEPGQPEALADAEKKLDQAYEKVEDPKTAIESRAKTLAEKQKLSPEKMNPAEIRESLKNLSVAQVRALEKTNPGLLFAACFTKNGESLVFDAGGVPALEKGVGLRVLPAEYNNLTLMVGGKPAYRLENGVFEYATGGYAAVETGKQTIAIDKTPPPADVLARLNSQAKSFYEQRDLNNFLRAFGGDNIDSNPNGLKIFGDMLAGGKIDGMPKDVQGALKTKVENNIKDQAELAKFMNMSDGKYAEIVREGGNAAVAFQYLKLSGLNLTDNQIAGIIGNLQRESGPNLNTTASGDGATSYGIAQWHNERKDNLFAFAKAQDNADPSALRTQLAFFVHELKTNESAALAQLQRTNTVEEATIAFENSFERSKDTVGSPGLNQRIAYAQSAYETSRAPQNG